MSLTVNNINNYSKNSAFKGKSTKAENSSVFTQIPQEVKIDKSNDGKFSVSEAGKNLVKGIVSPITNMFSSPKNFLLGAGMMAGSAVLIAATGGAIAPLFVAAGIGMGACQVAKAGYKFATAKNGDDVEKAFYDIGGATSTIGLSVAGARGSLKQASIKTEGLNTFSSVKTCFTSAKSLVKQSANVFKSGYYKTNLKSALNVAKTPQSIRKYSHELATESQENFNSSFNALKDVLPEEFQGALKGRSKCQVSIYEKMVRDRNSLKNKISTIKKDSTLSKSEKAEMIKDIKTKITNIDTDANVAKALVEDGYGARITNVTPENTDKLVNALAKATKEGKIEITEIENYRGANEAFTTANDFYFNEAQMEKLTSVAKNATTTNNTKSSGYTAVQLKVKPRNAKTLELQIRGKEINNVADWEHILYDLRQGKDIAKGNNELGSILAEAKKAVVKMTPEQNTQYKKFVYDNYINAQAKEFGKTVSAPEPVKGLDSTLSVENLTNMHIQSTKSTPKTIRNPFDISAQSAVIASTESLKERKNN